MITWKVPKGQCGKVLKTIRWKYHNDLLINSIRLILFHFHLPFYNEHYLRHTTGRVMTNVKQWHINMWIFFVEEKSGILDLWNKTVSFTLSCRFLYVSFVVFQSLASLIIPLFPSVFVLTASLPLFRSLLVNLCFVICDHKKIKKAINFHFVKFIEYEGPIYLRDFHNIYVFLLRRAHSLS